jgi:serine/threonine protein phosphatase PrpC
VHSPDEPKEKSRIYINSGETR